MSLANPGDPYVGDGGEVVETTTAVADLKKPTTYARVPLVMDHIATVGRSIKDMPHSHIQTQQAIFVVMCYHLMGMTPNEIAHAIKTKLEDVERLMELDEFQESFEAIFTEIVSANSNSMLAKVQHYSNNALDRVVALSEGAEKEIVKLKASQDILDRAGMVPKNVEANKQGGGEHQGLRIVIQDADDRGMNVDIQVQR